jgi:hypothetical protein
MNSQSSSQVVFEVPNGLLNADGNTGTDIPFARVPPVRYQQVYDASQFARVHAGGAFITRIWLRAECLRTWSFAATNVQLRLSTTSRGPDQLSAVFAENIGPDETVVNEQARYYAPTAAGTNCPAQGFGSSGDFILDIPFFYDPGKGNLLFDLRKGGTEWEWGEPLEKSGQDAEDVVGDSVSRAYAFSLTADQAEVVDSLGLVTQFEFFPTPVLSVHHETNAVILRWFWKVPPLGFRLQTSDRLAPTAAWVDHPEQGERTGVWEYTAVLPVSSLSTPRFFRLFWDTPQPLLGPVATVPVQVNPTSTP